MTRVLLIRHGETPWNRERRWQGHADIPLSADGLEQAARLAAHLARERPAISRLYASDLMRARQTADAVGRALGLVPIVDSAWREIAVGRWTGLDPDEIRLRFAEEWQRIVDGEDLPRGGGETFGGFTARVVAALDRMRDAHADETVAVVTHGGVIRALLLHTLALPFARLREVARIGNTAVAELRWDGRWTIFRDSHAPHLEPVPDAATSVE